MRESQTKRLDKLSNWKKLLRKLEIICAQRHWRFLLGSDRPNWPQAIRSAGGMHTEAAIFFVRSPRVAQTSDSRSRRAQQAAGAKESMCEEAGGRKIDGR